MKLRTWLLSAVLSLAALGLGCSAAAPPKDAKTIRIDVQGPPGRLFTGQVRASSPGQAGMSARSFEIKSGSSLEFKGGTSEYTIVLNGTAGCTYDISIDGKKMQRGQDMVVEDDKGPRITFDIDTAKK